MGAKTKKDKPPTNKVAPVSNLTAGLGKIPKIPKKTDSATEDGKKKEEAPSFADLMGAMDSKVKKTVKVPPSKNKNRDFLESLSTENKPLSSKAKTETNNKSSNSTALAS